MEVTVNLQLLFRFLDGLLVRWNAKPKQFPYNQRDAVLPQTLIPEKLRKNKRILACFYFYVCIYMRGGIESQQAFQALIRMWEKYPHFFDPTLARWLPIEVVQPVLKEFIGWDSRSAAKSWIRNSRQMCEDWDGNPLNLLKGLRSYEEACRRIKNKLTKKELAEAGWDGRGFRGFKEKMVSMILYFYDWEGWFEERFHYPAPADFHNFRLALNQEIIVVTPRPEMIGNHELISKPWRDAMMIYLKAREADPIGVADAIWLFSLVMCGNSPINRVPRENKLELFAEEDVPQEMTLQAFTSRRFRPALARTCLSCPILETCTLSIPSSPYYRKGKLMLRERLRVEDVLGLVDSDQFLPKAELASKHLFDPGG